MSEFRGSFLLKSVALLLLLILLVVILHYGRAILIPATFAVLLSIILLPVCKKLESWKLGSIASSIISILLLIIIITAVFFLSISQITEFTADMDQITAILLKRLIIVQDFIQDKTGISEQEQLQWIKDKYEKIAESSTEFIKNFLMDFSQFLFSFSLVLIYIFFFLMYRSRFKTFILKLFAKQHHEIVKDIINRIKDLILHYLTGLLIALTILGTMNAIGLLALGIRQAIFLGYLAGYLNIIPYVGTMIGSILPILVALIFKDTPLYAVGVAAVMAFNQFIDNNITTPNVVGSHVAVNPLAAIVTVIIGSYIWGVAGMILFIPLTGVFKIICDNIEPLQPIGYLLGEDESDTKPGFFTRLFSKLKNKK